VGEVRGGKARFETSLQPEAMIRLLDQETQHGLCHKVHCAPT
jgi:hypothetical protein